MSLLAGLLETFLIGVATPLTAACVIPLYPAFVSYLANNSGERRLQSPLALGLLIMAGVLSFIGLVGIVVTRFLESSITNVVGIVSPIAFAALLAIGIVLLFDLEVFSRVPTLEPPQSRSPGVTAYSYGFFFGAIILPCNPGFIALFFARVPVLFETQLQGLLGFLAYGLGIGAPLLALAVVSESFGQRVTHTIARHSTPINRGTGILMIGISLYYLFVVFRVGGLAI